MKWLIWSNEHEGWWAPAHRGYVKEMARAGRYSFEEACAIVHNANEFIPEGGRPNEAMILDGELPHETHRKAKIALLIFLGLMAAFAIGRAVGAVELGSKIGPSIQTLIASCGAK